MEKPAVELKGLKAFVEVASTAATRAPPSRSMSLNPR